ncbi:ferredoxin-2 [archaeon BMS3Bbin16]|nr:ferredoxin-2 [archaeon BMS3Bbin16]
MIEIIVDRDLCTGCGKCREVCPKGPRVWDISEVGGKKVATVLDNESCLYCTLCISRCPTDAIKIEIH